MPYSVRGHKQLKADGVYPFLYECPSREIIDQGIASKRCWGAIDVLSCIPEAAYAEFLARNPKWFIPSDGNQDTCPNNVAWGANLPEGWIVYLNPRAEQLSQEAVTGLAAHELAHAVLGHVTRQFDDSDPVEVAKHDSEEQQADELAGQWGYGPNIDRLRSDVEAM